MDFKRELNTDTGMMEPSGQIWMEPSTSNIFGTREENREWIDARRQRVEREWAENVRLKAETKRLLAEKTAKMRRFRKWMRRQNIKSVQVYNKWGLRC